MRAMFQVEMCKGAVAQSAALGLSRTEGISVYREWISTVVIATQTDAPIEAVKKAAELAVKVAAFDKCCEKLDRLGADPLSWDEFVLYESLPG
jgi:hypothetical protein